MGDVMSDCGGVLDDLHSTKICPWFGCEISAQAQPLFFQSQHISLYPSLGVAE